MPSTVLPSAAFPSTVFAAGIATGVGSLPHRDPAAAAALVLRCLPDLPAAPQLPRRDVREDMVAQCLVGVPGVTVEPSGDVRVDARAARAPRPVGTDRPEHLDPGAFGGLLAFVEAAARAPRKPTRVKAQLAGPLTTGVALQRAGLATDPAFDLAARAVRTRARAVEALFAHRLPDAALLLVLDEPALVRWHDAEPPLERERATDLLSTVLAGIGAVTGVHVCGPGDLRLALAAGPHVVHLDVGALSLDDAVALSRYLDGGGWVAWGAVPTDRPVGEHANALWKRLLDTWCELTRRGCDPTRLRMQALLAPACGLAGHGPSQAERALLLARELGDRVHTQAVGTRLSVGA